jgi:2-hydroxychromene-2-carboxylate isomerase
MTARPRLYFSFRSPYSWMAIERLRRTLPDLFRRAELFPYWDPDPVTEQMVTERGAGLYYQQMSRAKHLYVLADTKRMASRLGLAMAWPVDVDPWWELPHLGWLAARRAGHSERCYDALVAARWSRGENICDPAVFQRVIAAAGLDAATLAAAADDAGIRAEGAGCLVTAYEDDVFGVPYVRLGWQRFWGLDRMELFLEQFTAAGESGPATGPPDAALSRIAVGAYDRDTAGGCG